MEFPDRIEHEELSVRCKEWELAGYIPCAATKEDHPLKAKALHVFEPLDRSKPEVTIYVRWKLKEGIDYYWMVAVYDREWESASQVWTKQPLPLGRVASASTLGLLL